MSGLIGKKIDVYEITQLIGKGGMGEVYEARHTLIGRVCAIKVLPADENLTQEHVTRMIREAQAASALGHPNIVQIYDFRMDASGRFFMVMELLKGASLAELLAQYGALETNVAATIMMQVLSALAGAHAKGIVHRDLKPDNIYLAADPAGNFKVKLLDFGISKFTSVGADSLRLTKTGAVLGTPYYMSPEQAEGKKDLDKRSDIWSCGAILYEMVTGGVPFYGESYNEVMAAILMKPFTPPREYVPTLEEGMERIIIRAMEKNPQNRFASSEVFFKALLPFHNSEGVALGEMVIVPPFTGTNPLVSLDKMVAAASAQPLDVSRPIASLESIQVNPKAAGAPDDTSQIPAGGGLVGRTEPHASGFPQTITHGESIDGQEMVKGAKSASLSKLVVLGIGALVLLAAAITSILLFTQSDEGKKSEPSSKDSGVAASRVGGSDDAMGGARPAFGTAGHRGGTSPTGPGGSDTRSGDPMDSGTTLTRRDGRDAGSSSPREERQITITLEGLPAGARVVLDGKKVIPPIHLTADGERHCVKVWGSRRRFYVKCFEAVGDKTFQVHLKRVRRTRHRTRRRGSRTRTRGRGGKYDNPYTR